MPANIEVIIPDNVLDPSSMMRAISNSMTGQAKAVKVDFDVTTHTWSNRPSFKIINQGRLNRIIRTTSEIYGFVNFGTKPHVIRAKRAKVLAFQSGYKAKTRPRKIMSRSGGSFGEMQYRKSVKHPGTEARKFDEEIVKKNEPLLQRTVQRAIDFEVNRS